MDSNIVCANSSSRSFYGSLKEILQLSRQCTDLYDTVMIENSFKETTRDGTHVIRFVRLALTSKAFVIAATKERATASQAEARSRHSNPSAQDIITLFPWKSVKIRVFKISRRQCLKAMFIDQSVRYFEMPNLPKMPIFWELWCRYIRELNNSKKIWPFLTMSTTTAQRSIWEADCIKIYVVRDKKNNYQRPKWTDKYLYLGSIRETEDKIRPRPVPGLGKTEEIKLLYLKPRYFGCWEQSEHWVQCGESSPEFACFD